MTRPFTRRAVLATGITGIAGGALIGGCGILPGEHASEAPGNPAFGPATQRGDLRLSSPAFEEGGRIPNKYGHFFEDVNPPLAVSGVPDSARSLALILDGPDKPGGEFTHWLVWNIPPDIDRIPEGWTPPEGVVQGGNSYGTSDHGYVGPDPPDKQAYRFKLYALDTTVDLPRGASKRALGAAMDGHIVARTQLTGWYDFHSVAHESIGTRRGHSNVLGAICNRLRLDGIGRLAPLPSARSVLTLLALPLLGGVAGAHPSAGSSGSAHLVVDVIGFLVLAFVVYVVLSFVRRTLYPRLRGFL